MKAFYTTLLFLLSFSTLSLGQKYFSLNSGNWNNTSNVWSLNGVTPCGCFPGNNLNTDTVFVNHPINLTANLNASSLSKVQVNPGGSISNLAYTLKVTNSVVIADGSFAIKELNIATGGSFIISGSTLIINSRMLISGYFESKNSGIEVLNGNIEVSPTGSVVLGADSWIDFSLGNYKNAGYTSICPTCCLNLSSGNLQNDAGATFAGEGALITQGNIMNYGTWSSLLKWCAAGTTFGVSSSENCSGATDVCAFAPLPIELTYFDAYHLKSENILKWETASESNSDHFNIDKSDDGINWKTIGSVAAQGNSIVNTEYSFVDQNQTIGLKYYKLTEISQSGSTNYSKVLSLMSQSHSDLIYFPNPTNDYITVQLDEGHDYNSVRVVDAAGRELKTIEIGDAYTFDIQLPDQNGLYFLKAEGEGITTTYTLIKI